jgi:hypothetical protein
LAADIALTNITKAGVLPVGANTTYMLGVTNPAGAARLLPFGQVALGVSNTIASGFLPSTTSLGWGTNTATAGSFKSLTTSISILGAAPYLEIGDQSGDSGSGSLYIYRTDGEPMIVLGGSGGTISWGDGAGTLQGDGAVALPNILLSANGAATFANSAASITSGGIFTGDGSGLQNLAADQLLSGSVPMDVLQPMVTTNAGTLTSGRVQVGDGGRGVANATASGAVPIDADGTATTFAQVNGLASGNILTNGESIATSFGAAVTVGALNATNGGTLGGVFDATNFWRFYQGIISTNSNGSSIVLSNASIYASNNLGQMFTYTNGLWMLSNASGSGLVWATNGSLIFSNPATAAYGMMTNGGFTNSGGMKLGGSIAMSGTEIQQVNAGSLTVSGSSGNNLYLGVGTTFGRQAQIQANYLRLINSHMLAWSGDGTSFGTAVAAIGTNVAGGLEVNTGTTGTLTNLSARSYFFPSNGFPIVSFVQLGNSGAATWNSNGFALYLISTNAITAAGYTNYLCSLVQDFPAPTAITFPSSDVPWTNNTGRRIEVYIDNTGITGTAVKKNGTTILAGLIQGYTLVLRPKEYFSETYTIGTPVAVYSPID